MDSKTPVSKTASAPSEPNPLDFSPVYRLPYVPQLLDEPREARAVFSTLRSENGLLALDTERTQNRYQERITLLQLKAVSARALLVDVQTLEEFAKVDSREAVQTLAALQTTIAAHTCVIQDASTDLPCLRSQGLYPTRLFDTQVAARLLGFDRYGLAHLVAHFTGQRLEKSHANENWERRPLPATWLEYAALDVEFLGEVADGLAQQLARRGREQWAQEEFSYLLETYREAKTENEPWRYLKGASAIKNARSYTLLARLWEKREELARERDLNPRRICPDTQLVEFALNPPRSKREAASRIGLKIKNAYRIYGEWIDLSREVAQLPTRQLLQRQRLELEEIRSANYWQLNYPREYATLCALKAAVLEWCRAESLDPALALPSLPARRLAIEFTGRSRAEREEILRACGLLREWQKEVLASLLAKL